MAKIVEAVGTATIVEAAGATSQIVEAVGTATVNAATAKQIEAVMAHAVKQAMVDGVTDPDQVRDLMLAARERVKRQPQQ